MPISSNPGRMWAFIMVPFLENEVSNIKLYILIKSWTYWAWATKLDFQLLRAWWEASWTALPFSSVELFINALHRKPPHSGAEEAAWWNACLSYLLSKRMIRAEPSEILIWTPPVVIHCTPSPRCIISCQCQGAGSLSWSWGLRGISSALPAGRPTLSDRRNPRSKHTLAEEAPCTPRTPPASTAALLAEGSPAQEGRTRGILAKQGGGGRLTCADGQAARLAIWERPPGNQPAGCLMWLKTKYEMLQKREKQDRRSGLHNLVHLCNQSK